MEKANKIRLMLGPAMLLLGIAMVWASADSVIVTMLLSVGSVLVISGLYKHLKYGKLSQKDERTRKIDMFALGYSWAASMTLAALLIWLDHFSLLKMTIPQALGLTISIMILTALIFRFYLERKGDVE